MPTYTTSDICRRLGGQLEGPGDLVISGVDELHAAQAGQITFLGDVRHGRDWPSSSASAALIGSGVDVPPGAGRALIRVDDAEVAVAAVLDLFAPPPAQTETGVHESAVVHGSAQVGRSVSIGANAVVAPNARIGDHTVVHANVTLLDDVQIGESCVIWSGAVIRERCRIGDRCIVHSNATIGADGFGYRPAPGGNGVVKIPQIGTVEIGDDVEIGACTCIDRGKFSATQIGDGTKIDNLCQIAHNCRVGRGCIIAGCTAIAGSVTVGDGVVMGGHVSVKDHITIGRGARLAARAGVMNDVPDEALWAGAPAKDAKTALREHVAFRRLPDLLERLKKPGKPG